MSNPWRWIAPERQEATHKPHPLQRAGLIVAKNSQTEEFINIMEFISFTKPYKGRIYRNGKPRRKKFYDEREWRYIPNISEEKCYRLEKEEYLNEVDLANYNNKIENRYTLSFNPSDIKYIIVKKENEIYSMIKAIRRIKIKYNPKDVDILTSRILTSEQILDDF